MIKTWAVTDTGLVRKENQDTYRIVRNGDICVVCDGMGGAAGGRLASTLASETYAAEMEKALKPDMTPEQLREDMAGTAQMIEEMTGIWPVLMRPPGGAYDEKVLREAEQEGMRVILWSVDPRDWATHDARQVLSTMAREAGDGDVILMHNGHGRNRLRSVFIGGCGAAADRRAAGERVLLCDSQRIGGAEGRFYDGRERL